VDYIKELKRIFNGLPTKEHTIEVTKIVLVHDIEEIIELEQQLDKCVKQKQYALQDNLYIHMHITQCSCKYSDPKITAFDEQIEEIEHNIHHLESHLNKTCEKFTGIAFISFQTEGMK
jgi:hypothetical protein